MAHAFLAEVISKEDVVVDATMGNGHDTLFLAKLAKEVYAFDVQEQAVENTRLRLQEAGVDNANLILAGHEQAADYVQSIKAAVFNLGYLPAADKSVITKPHTTLQALESLLEALEIGGRIALMIYYGHEGGAEEKDAVLEFVEQLPQQTYTVAQYRTLNQINTPPFLIMIEKLKGYNHG